MQDKNSFSQREISNTIYNLRLKLNKTYLTHGHTDEVVRISQELDRYIVLVQQQLRTKSLISI
ncbi:Spo0E family sporulation regulatory protein-aspartic acid phosphatase [Wukongibacter baidiensis]|uniref:Spo0E family sporulation regulatory protein-aspartic acid phosphatase n=1 Tax=Wukongibacter baidiensis TaxID=1723361 RepID=UPI003D7F5D7B